ncbi:hypothetical protein SGR_1609 [Streptomyces griseus subsp. griseus NBRC 13350]|uniref:Uncharacterized protein n=1 Tax=Streptomyces griseus subsp. griseus (strain JCM 4626 / CBS 651.72 / NBRC 13350 / KCC S-0626 / ISP 5235) TaxID=455632 RepID=B1VXH2_STRGG|nr:hypothetical protein SGR_1609 [Streptomyces griseus subsp. griseus NBRC 13350]
MGAAVGSQVEPLHDHPHVMSADRLHGVRVDTNAGAHHVVPLVAHPRPVVPRLHQRVAMQLGVTVDGVVVRCLGHDGVECTVQRTKMFLRHDQSDHPVMVPVI